MAAGSILRVFPESIAGAIDARTKITALVADHGDLKQMARDNDRFDFESNKAFAPTEYTLYLEYKSFISPPTPGQCPPTANEHTVTVILPAEYPNEAPIIRWESAIFHPNIHATEKIVCLGQLGKRYLPGLGLARIVSMLIEIVQWRNYDILPPTFNDEAARWASNPDHYHCIGKYWWLALSTALETNDQS